MRAAERQRMAELHAGSHDWRRFGPYLGERQWGTVREDYSPNGAAWDYFPHDHARSRAYRWGEDGIGGFSDDQQRLCLGLALWNTRDPILKERLFGLTGPEGNHGEDVKELYYYLDATPSHSFMRMLYKYPQAEFPYERLVAGNRARGRLEAELEIIDTGVFDDSRYFDVFVEYAKAAPEDVLMRVRVCNRGPEAAPLVVVPQVWFRNSWSWGRSSERPTMRGLGAGSAELAHPTLGRFSLHCDQPDRLAFCDNETNHRRLHGANNADVISMPDKWEYPWYAAWDLAFHCLPLALHRRCDGQRRRRGDRPLGRRGRLLLRRPPLRPRTRRALRVGADQDPLAGRPDPICSPCCAGTA